MPTGYTTDIAKGITFQQYAWSCARAFGALVLMRDDPADAPIPERFEPTDYHTNALTNASERLAQLRLMSPADADAAAEAAFLAEQKRHTEALAEKTDLRNKYSAMLAQVVQWEPPTPDHVNYKAFMVSQLRDSIDGDCDESYYLEHPPQRLSTDGWLAQEIARAERDIEYHTKHHAEEVQRTEGRNGWIKALRDSLGSRDPTGDKP